MPSIQSFNAGSQIRMNFRCERCGLRARSVRMRELANDEMFGFYCDECFEPMKEFDV
jgi:ribosomal protein S14